MTDEELAEVARGTPATDLLEEHGLDEDAATLRDAPGKADLLERAVDKIEDLLRNGPIRVWSVADPLVAIIAEHRGETPEATLARLRPRTAFFPRDGENVVPPGANLNRMIRESIANLNPAVDWSRVPRGTFLTRDPDGTARPYRPLESPGPPLLMYGGEFDVLEPSEATPERLRPDPFDFSPVDIISANPTDIGDYGEGPNLFTGSLERTFVDWLAAHPDVRCRAERLTDIDSPGEIRIAMERRQPDGRLYRMVGRIDLRDWLDTVTPDGRRNLLLRTLDRLYRSLPTPEPTP